MELKGKFAVVTGSGGSMPQKSVKPPWLDRTLFPFRSLFIEIDGNTVHYIDEGSGPVLLLLHGNPTYSFLYRHIVRILSPHFRCIALDYPGFGLSSEGPGYSFKPRQHSDVVEKFVLALRLHEIRLMVQDWGGPIGLGFAGRHPELVHSLFIGNTWAWPAQEVKHMARFSRVVGSPIGIFLIERFNLFVNHLLPNGINRKLSKAEMAAYRGPFTTPKSRRPLAILPREILGSRDYLCEVENGLEGLFDKPVLLLWGDADAAFTEHERKRFEQKFPGAVTCALQGAKHFIQECAPEQICEAILLFEGSPMVMCASEES
jgi:haloalkane dehalogenase